ncbi:MAG: ketoacyl-ACP synthase III [Clostridiales bacterium]|jgi:3-oxoacyl-[acyl-carrier-protein] synthase-3|nr:ketoacyl-ACP synthase III [Clostridiales bacterium]
MAGTRIIKAARAVPGFVVTNDDLTRLVDTSDEWIITRTGINTRRVSQGETTASLASDVFKQLVTGTRRGPEDVDLLILSTVTPDYMTPQSSAFVLRDNGAKNAFAFDMNAACTAFVYALSVAEKMLTSGVYKTAAVISSDTLTKITDWSDRGTCVLFGDGAGGVLMEYDGGPGGILAEDLHTDGEMATAIRGGRLPVNNAWHKDEGPVEPFVIMDGRATYDFTVREIPKSISATLEKARLTMDDIKYVVCHQANARILNGIAKKLKTGMDKFFVTINEFGNTSSSSVPIALSVMLERGMIEKGDKIMFAGFGAGLTWGTLIYQY